MTANPAEAIIKRIAQLRHERELARMHAEGRDHSYSAAIGELEKVLLLLLPPNIDEVLSAALGQKVEQVEWHAIDPATGRVGQGDLGADDIADLPSTAVPE